MDFEDLLKIRLKNQIIKRNNYNLENSDDKRIEEEVIRNFNNKINCGGYALKVDINIYPSREKDFSKSVSKILQMFPFVQLLGNRKLKCNEYLVLYRVNQKGTGHHFIRIDADGIAREKDGSASPKIFNGWKKLENCKQAIFAVKKEHKMFGYDCIKMNFESPNGLNFYETVTNAIENNSNEFKYHGHDFSFTEGLKGKDVVMSDGMKIADINIKSEEIKILDCKKKYVENFSGKALPIIKNGCLENIKDFFQEKDIRI